MRVRADDALKPRRFLRKTICILFFAMAAPLMRNREPRHEERWLLFCRLPFDASAPFFDADARPCRLFVADFSLPVHQKRHFR